MKKSLILFAALAFLSGCQMAEITPTVSKDSKTFEGVIVNDTRADLVSDGNVWHIVWALGEKISINDIIYTATVGDVSSTYFVRDAVNFETDADAPYTAYSPADIAKGLPAVQNYAANNVAYVPMMAKSETETLLFKNLASILKINVTTGEADAKLKRLELKADQPLSGEFTVENDAAVVSGSAGVTLNCGEGVAIGADPVPFYVTVPAGSYTGLVVTAVLMDGRTQTLKLKAGSTITAERSKVHEGTLAFNNFSASPAVDGKAVLLAGPEFNAAVKGLAVPGAFMEDLDYLVKRVVISVCDPSTEGVLLSAADSPVPVYGTFEPTSGVVTVATAAKSIATGEDASYMFSHLMCLEAFDNLKALDTESAVNMSYMFCQNTPEDTTLYALKSLDVSGFNTANCTDMTSMFNSNRALEHLDVSNFNTSNVESTRYMFGNCRHLEEIDLSNFDFSQDTSMAYMFYYNEHMKSVKFPDGINTENVLNMRNMFNNCASLEVLDVSKFNTAACTDMGYMFEYCGMLTKLDISSFDFSSDSTMYYMFAYDSALVELVLPEEIVCDEMINLNSAFRKLFCLTEFDMDVFVDADNVNGLRYTFSYCPNLTKVSSKNNTWADADMAYIFAYSCENSASLDLSDFDVAEVAKFSYFFYRNKAQTLNLDNWDTNNATAMSYMFYQCPNLATLRLGKDFVWNVSGSNPTNFCGGTSDSTSGQMTSSVPGALKIYCTKETADWLATTLWRKLHWGSYGQVIDITFWDLTTGSEIFVEWSPS